MNLMKLFNLNYLKQNVKKSKVILSIFIGLIPILNTIILIMAFSSGNNYVFNFSEISVINFIGVYILPIIVSICLFNYIYKRKSVDFVNSMPISRKSIFVTNTIFGILVFISMLLVNIILMSFLTLIFNIPIPFAMIFDYLWYWFIVYMFSFSATNVAMSISGNAITQVIVTLLLIFLIPFTHAFTTALSNEYSSSKTYLECDKEECIPKEYYCYDDLECNINKNANIYEVRLRKQTENNYTGLFGYLYMSLEGSGRIINTTSIIKMIVLTIAYTIIGYILFLRRKMEVNETSFKNIHIHNIVKTLTLVPIIAFAYIILKEANFISGIFVLVIILIYYFVYDLITKKSINNIKLSLIYFVFGVSILIIFYSSVEVVNKKEEKDILKYTDIKEVAIDISNSLSGYTNSNKETIYIKSPELIELVVNNTFDTVDNDERNNHFKVYLKDKKNNEYSQTIRMTKEDYYKVIDLISLNKEYIKYYKNIDLNNVYAVKIGNNLYNKKDSEAILKLINESLSKLTLKELLDLQNKYNNVSDDFYISLYSYNKHDMREFKINGYINYDLLNSIVNSNNSHLKQNIDYIIPDEYYIYFSDMYVTNDFEIDYYVLKNAKNEIYDYILNEVGKEVNMRYEFVTLELSLDHKMYLFTTNNVKGFKEILDNKYEEIKDTEEYKKYYGLEEKYYDDKYYFDLGETKYDY